MKYGTNDNLKTNTVVENRHQLPGLKYDYGALEPHIDRRTMELHHDVHHKTYVDKLNEALDKFPEFKNFSAISLLCNLEQVPEEIRTEVRHNAGGHMNHSMFWRAMTPNSNGGPKGLVREAICRSFGTIEKFKAKFEEEGAKLFGSGWVWLVQVPKSDGKLEVMTTSGHDNPMMYDRFPLLLNDVWEHAYYLHYQSRRPEYLKEWWPLADWDEVAHRFDLCSNSNEELCKIEEENLNTTEG
jgi:superoxide dismutase, Fe-Mn family